MAPAPAATTPAATAPTVAEKEISGPRIQFETNIWNFGKIDSGTVAKHEFIFTNTGNATLEILDVRPGCGCTTAGAWDKKVEPGKTGIIPLQFNSANFGGTVTKSATITCNDPRQSNVVLQITANVWKAIDVTPTMAVFNVNSDTRTNETRVIRIVNNVEKPLSLSDLQCTNSAFKAELKTIKEGKEFELHVTAIPPFKALSTFAPISVKTSSTNLPVINVTAYVMVQEPVTFSPNQIVLQSGALTNSLRRDVMIRANTAEALALSEPKVNVPGAEVRLNEVAPGKMFALAVTFPAGLEIKPEQKYELSVKSNHPRFALIQVPIYQIAAPAPFTPSKVSALPTIPAKTTAALPGGK
ncbi:MAG: DUF1573 domain-containing protein [Verrucomicrobia subdivision 3 bacterium]|nr:DUF1573 domain-containing protein [Limisphaerales bacterium]